MQKEEVRELIKTMSGSTVKIDFSNYPEIYEELKTFAKITVRDLPHAILSILNEKFCSGLYQVSLVSFGERKIQCIKTLRDITGMGLKEAKHAIESTKMRPLPIAKGHYTNCYSIKEKFESGGDEIACVIDYIPTSHGLDSSDAVTLINPSGEEEIEDETVG